jgi:hypothetical protein
MLRAQPRDTPSLYAYSKPTYANKHTSCISQDTDKKATHSSIVELDAVTCLTPITTRRVGFQPLLCLVAAFWMQREDPLQEIPCCTLWVVVLLSGPIPEIHPQNPSILLAWHALLWRMERKIIGEFPRLHERKLNLEIYPRPPRKKWMGFPAFPHSDAKLTFQKGECDKEQPPCNKSKEGWREVTSSPPSEAGDDAYHSFLPSRE